MKTGMLMIVAALCATIVVANECDDIIKPVAGTYKPAKFNPSAEVKWMAGLTKGTCLTLPDEKTKKFSPECQAVGEEVVTLVAGPICIGVITMLIWSFYCCFRKKCCGQMKFCNAPDSKNGARFVPFVLFAIIFITCWTMYVGKSSFEGGISTVLEAGESVNDTSTTIDRGAATIITAAGMLIEAGTALKDDVCKFAFNPKNQELRETGEGMIEQGNVMTAASKAVIETVTLPESFDEAIKEIKAADDTYLAPGVSSIVALYAVTCIVAFVGLFVCTKLLLSISMCLGFLVVVLTSLLIASELALGSIISDICVPSPRANIVDILFSNEVDLPGMERTTPGVSSDASTFIDYALNCEGDNPFFDEVTEIWEQIDSARKSVCDIKSQVDVLKKAELLPDNLSKCEQTLASTQTALADLQTSFGTIAGIAIACETFNKPLVLLTDSALCDDLPSGIYSMYATQAVATFTLVLAMFVLPCTMVRLTESGNGGDRKKSLQMI